MRNITKVGFYCDYFIFENELNGISHIRNFLVLYLYTILSTSREKNYLDFLKLPSKICLTFQYKESLIADFTQRALPHFSSGEFRPIIDTTLPLDSIQEAHTLMESNKTTGKIVLQVRDQVKDEL